MKIARSEDHPYTKKKVVVTKKATPAMMDYSKNEEKGEYTPKTDEETTEVTYDSMKPSREVSTEGEGIKKNAFRPKIVQGPAQMVPSDSTETYRKKGYTFSDPKKEMTYQKAKRGMKIAYN